MVRITKTFSAVLIALSLTQHVYANEPTQDSMTVESADGRFDARLRSDTVDHAIGRGFVEDVKLEIGWWSLMGQAVEIYGFQWNRGETYSGSDFSLERSELVAHPDLLERFDAMRPLSVTVDFDILAYPQLTDERESTQVEIDANGPNFYSVTWGRVVSGKKSTDNVLIAESGTMLQDFSPSSPQDWKSFVTFDSRKPLREDDREVATKNTFQLARSIRFSNLIVTTLDLPDSTARSIFREWKRREENEETLEDHDDKSEVENLWAENNDLMPEEVSDSIWSDVAEVSPDVSQSENLWTSESVDAAKKQKVERLEQQMAACEARPGMFWTGENCVVPYEQPKIVLRRTRN